MATEKEAWAIIGQAFGSVLHGFAYLLGRLLSPFRVRSKKLPASQTTSEIKKLYQDTKTLYDQQHQFEPSELVSYILEEAQKKAEKKFLPSFVEPIFDIVLDLGQEEGLFGLNHLDIDNFSFSDQIHLKNVLEKYNLRYQNFNEILQVWADALIDALASLLLALPNIKTASTDGTVFKSSLLQLLDNPKHNINDFIEYFFSPDIGGLELYDNLREQFNRNAFELSGIDPHNPKGRNAVLPKDSKLSVAEIVQEYFKYTPFISLFSIEYDFVLNTDWRFEHTHVLAGTGYGKTQLLQKLILSDLEANNGFMVIDSQGDLIRKIKSLEIFNPESRSHKNRLIVIDPEDVEFPPCLNMFDLGFASNVSALEKERQINKTIDLYTYMFGALFGSELTAKQGVIFRYIARLIFEIPNATVQTLRELITDGEKYQPYMNRLEGSAKAFFATEFFSSSFASTKKQVLSRLWAVLSNATLERMFSSASNKIDLFEAMNSNSVVLVNTSKDLLGTEGSAILGRFFIALLSQSIIRRASIPENQRTNFFAYIDEAQEYFDDKIEEMLSQARKYRTGFILAHQSLDQLGAIKGSVLANTTVKIAGGMSFVDSKAMASEMKTSAETLSALRKTERQSQFGCFVKNFTSSALPITVEFGLLEQQPKLSEENKQLLLEQNRQKYCIEASQISFDEVVDVETTKAKKKKSEVKQVKEAEPVPKQEAVTEQVVEPVEIAEEPQPKVEPKEVKVKPQGKGGLHHKYLQNLVKRAGQERGFLSTIEASVLEGLGSVDIALHGFNKRIAVEVSVNTQSKWESSNIAKCLSANYDYVVLLSSEKDHLQKLEDKISAEFKSQFDDGIVKALTPPALISFLDEVRANSSSFEETVSGYKVKVNYVASTKEEQRLREEAIARVILG